MTVYIRQSTRIRNQSIKIQNWWSLHIWIVITCYPFHWQWVTNNVFWTFYLIILDLCCMAGEGGRCWAFCDVVHFFFSFLAKSQISSFYLKERKIWDRLHNTRQPLYILRWLTRPMRELQTLAQLEQKVADGCSWHHQQSNWGLSAEDADVCLFIIAMNPGDSVGDIFLVP